MSAATLSDTEVQSLVLAAADTLFYARGVSDVSMAEIRDTSGVSMRRLYAFAPSKTDLVARWLEQRHIEWSEEFAQRIDDHIAAAATPLDALFDALADWMTDTSFRGCGFINTHAESADLTEEHRTIIAEHKASFAAYLEDLLGHGHTLGVLVDGAIVQASIFSNTDPIRHAHTAAKALLEANRTK